LWEEWGFALPETGRIGFVPVTAKRRFLRCAISFALLLVQVNLLWAAGFHCHISLAFVPGHHAAIRHASRRQPSAVRAEFLCTACQIIRQNAARPAAGVWTPELAACVIFAFLAPSGRLYSQVSTLIYGRAPPLS